MQSCPLCRATEAAPFFKDNRREYLKCINCSIVFVPASFYLPPSQEKARYDQHQNSPDDPRYRQFLSRLFKPLNRILPPRSRGLDFGCGPGPTLSVMFEEAGHEVAVYDPFYAHDRSVFDRRYDFICATEVLEHLHNPMRDLQTLWGCLMPDGKLGVMTRLIADPKDFSAWYYKDDPTHICFYAPMTFRWLAKQWQAGLTFIDSDVIILEKNAK